MPTYFYPTLIIGTCYFVLVKTVCQINAHFRAPVACQHLEPQWHPYPYIIQTWVSGVHVHMRRYIDDSFYIHKQYIVSYTIVKPYQGCRGLVKLWVFTPNHYQKAASAYDRYSELYKRLWACLALYGGPTEVKIVEVSRDI